MCRPFAAALLFVLLVAPQGATAEDLAEKERALQERVTALRAEIQSVEAELAAVRKQRAVAELDKTAISFSSSSLCLYDELPQGQQRCKPGPYGTYRILEYMHSMRLSKVLTPDDRVAFAQVGLIDLPDGPAAEQFRLLIEREAERYSAQQEQKASQEALAAAAREQAAEEQRAAGRRAAAEKRAADLRKKYAGSPYVESIVARKAGLGMTAEMVRDAWGSPNDINRTILADVTKEQWVYGSKSYVYFECQSGNCVVTAIQN